MKASRRRLSRTNLSVLPSSTVSISRMGRIWLRDEGTEHFPGDLSEAEQKMMYATAIAPAQDVFALAVPCRGLEDEALLGHVVGSKDHTVDPELQPFVAKRMDAKTTELESSDVPRSSQPDAVIGAIRDAASSCSPAPCRVSSRPALPQGSRACHQMTGDCTGIFGTPRVYLTVRCLPCHHTKFAEGKRRDIAMSGLWFNPAPT